MLPVGTPMPSAVLRDQYGAEVVLGEVDDDIDGPDTVALSHVEGQAEEDPVGVRARAEAIQAHP